MKNKPKLSIGIKNYEILKYLSTKDEVIFTEISKKFNLKGNGIFLRQLLQMDFIDRIQRGRYKINKRGMDLLKLL